MSMNHLSHQHPQLYDERRRPDWQQNDRRRTWPWVADSNDRRSGFDRRVVAGMTSQ